MSYEQSCTYFIRRLAENLKAHWRPARLPAEDSEMIPVDWMIGVVSSVINGTGLGGYVERLYAHFTELEGRTLKGTVPEEERQSEAVDLSDVSELERRDRRLPSRRSTPRRRVP